MKELRTPGLIVGLFLLCSPFMWGQTEADKELSGIVQEESEDDELIPVVGAQIYWAQSQKSTFSGQDGRFSLPSTGESLLVVNFVGFEADTIDTQDSSFIEITLKKGVDLETVEITYERRSTEISMINPINMENMGEKELFKAACCNLSESFETNPSVDMSFTDAVTGTRQIEMLGLAGPNVLYTVENIPALEGFSALYGLSFVPGTWIESIQLSKGVGSVLNGYGGISGQINVEEKKAESGENNYLNAYYNALSRTELNYNHRREISDKVSTALLTHFGMRPRRIDVNDDGFMDQPEQLEYSVLNRWRFTNDKGWRSRLVLESSMLDQVAGQMDYEKDKDNNNLWGMESRVQNHSVWAKLGKVNTDLPWRSFGSQYKVSYYSQDSEFGNRSYSNIQRNYYANFIYQSIIDNTNHVIKMGASGKWDVRDERLDGMVLDRTEKSAGVYSEYAFSPSEDFDLVAGLRLDYHNLFDWFVTPRLHLRYSPAELTVFRLSGGRAQRTADIISDNMGFLASNREYLIDGQLGTNLPYGMPATVAWNAGFGWTQGIVLGDRSATFVAEYYRTSFTEAVVVDREQSPQEVNFYALGEGDQAFANSYQARIDIEWSERLDLRFAYRHYDVQTDYRVGRRANPLVAPHRFFANAAYMTGNGWSFDYTVNWIGEQRLPPTQSNPDDLRLAQRSPNYFLHNTQITKSWPRFDIYFGSSNLFDFRQEEAIIDADNPFGNYFDASNIWAPVQGRNIYLGFRTKW